MRVSTLDGELPEAALAALVPPPLHRQVRSRLFGEFFDVQGFYEVTEPRNRIVRPHKLGPDVLIPVLLNLARLGFSYYSLSHGSLSQHI